MVNSTTIAYSAGSTAYHAGQISLEGWHLYEKLVFWSRELGYCWYKVATLAETFGRSPRHIGRWLKELVTAGLIRRVRRAHTSAETHITALDPQSSFFDDPMSDHDATPMSDRTIKSESLNGGDLAPAGEIFSERERGTTPPHSAPPSPRVAELEAAGLVDAGTIEELATKPPALIRQAVAYVKAQRKGPGLIAWLLRHDIAIPDATEETPHERQPRLSSPRGHAVPSAVSPAADADRPQWTFIGGSLGDAPRAADDHREHRWTIIGGSDGDE